MITAPLMSHKVKVELPKASLDKIPETPLVVQPITITVSDEGNLYWNDQPITKDQIESKLSVEAQKTPQPAINVRGDRTTKYRVVQQVVQVAQNQGMRKVGFVAEKERP
jgi:biopolymer transport protein ExbD